MAKVENLTKILYMIHQCDEYLHLPGKWIFESQEIYEARLRQKEYVRQRLTKYYAKKVFELASNAYSQVSSQPKQSSNA